MTPRKPKSTRPEPHRIIETQAGKAGRRWHCLKCGAEFRSRKDAEGHEANARMGVLVMCRRPSFHETLRRLAAEPRVPPEVIHDVALIFGVTDSFVVAMLPQYRRSFPRTR